MLNKDYKPKVGDKLYLHANSRKYKNRNGIIEVILIQDEIFYVKRNDFITLKFYLNTFLQDNGVYHPEYTIFASKQDCKYYFETFRRRRCLTDRLFRFLTDEEVNGLYNELILRDK